MAKETHYTEAVGRRKTATARVRISEAKSPSMMVNGKTAAEYFPLEQMVKTAFAPMQMLGASYAVSARVHGGGHKAQAEAVRHGLSRAMTELVPEQRKDLKVRGFLKRDPRAKERKKFGLKAARRAPQWSKR
ncbi:30S ribosomal protein S9 [Candidatus Kaiserbacteria bacterium RIFCSPHIGHO2_01_FULL_53_29]|uniref:Small ribosomal subunit protein uS9 n=1 Tax=Candidatus Kaiserbacteria bacterium RIFCSPHIGHO2_01_FULL_53_29 TaxID=1798480 RepID=A0A1F6CVP4_9BACT|nr:MAG: 30S ribosomal protein S9 [Candidatus Kaiserbacteria bacterium RIFCSPHIGHO2_01_FULL_53_29]